MIDNSVLRQLLTKCVSDESKGNQTCVVDDSHAIGKDLDFPLWWSILIMALLLLVVLYWSYIYVPRRPIITFNQKVHIKHTQNYYRYQSTVLNGKFSKRKTAWYCGKKAGYWVLKAENYTNRVREYYFSENDFTQEDINKIEELINNNKYTTLYCEVSGFVARNPLNNKK